MGLDECLLRKEFSSNQQELFKGLPEKLIPQGLSAERQWYLYDQIRMHIPNASNKDATCPKSSMDKPKKGSNSRLVYCTNTYLFT
jgi:hypothetical protein